MPMEVTKVKNPIPHWFALFDDEAKLKTLDVASQVHSVRVVTKKLRSLCRLLKYHPQSHQMSAKIRSLQVVAHRLRTARRYHVAVQTLEALHLEASTGYVATLANQRQLLCSLFASHAAFSNEFSLEDVDSGLAVCRVRAKELAQSWEDLSAVPKMRDCLAQSAKKLRKATDFKSAAALSADDLHTLRKRVKDMLFQIQVIAGPAPKELNQLRKTLDEVAGELGKHQDLIDLMALIQSHLTDREREFIGPLTAHLRDHAQVHASRVIPDLKPLGEAVMQVLA
jgi:CHAD domain-containing protein